MKKFLLVLVLLGQGCNTREDFSAAVFLKYYGKDGNHSAADLILNEDGSFYLLGTLEYPAGVFKIYLAKADPGGEFISEQIYTLFKEGGGVEDKCHAQDMEVTGDGNLVILADAGDPASQYCQLLKADPNSPGMPLLLAKSYTGKGMDGKTRQAIDVTSVTRISGGATLSPGYVVTGSQVSENANDMTDALHVYFDEYLNQVEDFTTTHSQGSRDVLVKAFQYKDSRIVVFGYTNSSINSANSTINYWTYLLDKFGVPGAIFKIPYKGEAKPDESDEYATGAIRVGPGSGYMISGFSTTANSNSSPTLPYFIKLSNDLRFQDSDVEFASTLNSDGDNLLLSSFIESTTSDNLKKITACSSKTGGYYVLATRYTTLGDILLFKLDSNGKEVWKRVLGGESEDFAASVTEAPDGSIIVFGTITVGINTGKYKKIALFRLNANGRLD